MPQSSNHKSRRKTPWDNSMERTATQQFLFEAYGGMYQQRHPILLETGEDALINSFVPDVCPHCHEMVYGQWFYGHLHDNRRVMDNHYLLYEQIIRIN